MADIHTCEECGKRLATGGGLEIHMAMSHGAAAPTPHAEPEEVDAQPALGVAPRPVAVASPPMGLPTAPKPPRAPLFGGLDPAEPLAWILTVLLFLGAVAAAIHHPHPPSDVSGAIAASTAVPETTTTTADPAKEDEIAKAAMPGPAELPGWSVVSARTVPTDELTAPNPCLPDPALTQSTAGEEQRRRLSQGRTIPAELLIQVASAPSPSVAGAQVAVANRPEYATCEVQDFEAGLRNGGGGAVHVQSTSQAPLSPSLKLPLPGTAHKFVSHVTNDNGVALVITTDDYVFGTGRVTAHVLFVSVGTPVTQATEDTVMHAVAQRMTQLASR
jgi:hypothetical protein